MVSGWGRTFFLLSGAKFFQVSGGGWEWKGGRYFFCVGVWGRSLFRARRGSKFFRMKEAIELFSCERGVEFFRVGVGWISFFAFGCVRWCVVILQKKLFYTSCFCLAHRRCCCISCGALCCCVSVAVRLLCFLRCPCRGKW